MSEFNRISYNKLKEIRQHNENEKKGIHDDVMVNYVDLLLAEINRLNHVIENWKNSYSWENV